MRVFISHSRINSGAALKLAQALEELGIRTWLDVEELTAGADWNQQVSASIRSCDAILFLIGPPGPDDRWQQFEWQQVTEEEYFLDSSKPLIPIVIDGAEVPGFLTARNILEVEHSSIDFAHLARTVATFLAQPEGTVNFEKLELGKQVRASALMNLAESLLSSAKQSHRGTLHNYAETMRRAALDAAQQIDPHSAK